MTDIDQYRGVISFPDWSKVQLESKDFWPSKTGPEEHQSAMVQFLKTMDPLVRFLETATFAIPEYGILTSASIGLLWGAVQPSTIHLYQEHLKTMVDNILESKLQSTELSHARSSLDQFNSYLKDAAAFALPEQDDDVKHSKDIAKRYEGYVDPGGLLMNAFYTIKDNLPWFTPSAHVLLITAMQQILQAYQVRLMIWHAIALRARSKDDVHGYNEAQLEVCFLLNRLQHVLPELQAIVKQRINDLKQARLKGCVADYDQSDTNHLTDHRHHRDAKYRSTGFVIDPATGNKILYAGLAPTSTGTKILDAVGTIISLISPSSEGDGKEDGTADDEHFALVMGEAIKQYKERLLPPHIDEPFVKLLEGVQKVVDQSNKLYSFRLPGKPAHGPAFIPGGLVSGPKEAVAGLKVGDKISYRYTLHASKTEPELCTSPWSYSMEHVEPGKLQQIYVGDGVAAMETTRKIYRRTSENDAVGTLVATIPGHGILTWPADVHHGSI